MKNLKYILLFSWIFLFNQYLVFGQDPVHNFMGEGNRNEVKLFWLPSEWPKDMSGYNIKRRNVGKNTGEWVQLNSTVIFPGNYLDKDITNAEPDISQQQRLQQKRKVAIQSGKSKALSRDEYAKEVLYNEERLKGVSLLMAMDFDWVVLKGFALIDRKIPRGGRYEYGLFPVFGEEETVMPAAIYTWEYGSNPDTHLDITAATETVGKNKGIVAIWKFDLDIFRKKLLKGFNIYKKRNKEQFKLQNDRPIWIASENNPARLTFRDKFPENNDKYTYEAKPVTIFGTEGKGYSVVFETPETIEQPVSMGVLTVEAKSNATGVEIIWNSSSDRRVKSYILERKSHVDSTYSNQVSLKANINIYTDLDVTGDQYYFYRLRKVMKDGTQQLSNEVLLQHQIREIVPFPQNIKAEVIQEGMERYVLLTWDNPGEESKYQYALYTGHPENNTMVREGSVPSINTNTYKYKIERIRGALYRFALKTISNSGKESELSKVTSIFVPTEKLPPVVITTFDFKNNNVEVTWQYPNDIGDLSGFKIYDNNELIATEDELDTNTRQWKGTGLSEGRHRFQVVAITRFNKERKSQIRSCIVK